jgi:hypothetical protein
LEERDVLDAAGEVSPATHQEGLIDDALEVAVRRLVIAVLVGLPHVDAFTGQTVVPQQLLVTPVELTLG